MAIFTVRLERIIDDLLEKHRDLIMEQNSGTRDRDYEKFARDAFCQAKERAIKELAAMCRK